MKFLSLSEVTQRKEVLENETKSLEDRQGLLERQKDDMLNINKVFRNWLTHLQKVSELFEFKKPGRHCTSGASTTQCSEQALLPLRLRFRIPAYHIHMRKESIKVLSKVVWFLRVHRSLPTRKVDRMAKGRMRKDRDLVSQTSHWVSVGSG